MRHTPCKAIVNIRHRQQPVNGCQYRRWIQGIGKSVISLNIEVRVNQLLVAVAFLIAITSSAYSGLTHAVQEQQRQGQELVTTYQLNLPAQPLAAALNTLSEQTELQVLFPYDIVRSHSIKPLRGRYTIQQALSTMLHNTGLYGGLANSGVITIFADDLNQNGKGKRNMNSKKKLLASTIAFFMGSAVQGVVGQDDVGGQEENEWALEEIVVTAQKREERLIDVPISVVAMSEEVLKDAGIQTMDELSYFVPNLSVTSKSSGIQTFNIRGVGNASGSSPLVGIYFDETPVSIVPALTVDLYALDVQRVEVLRGPQGTFYGQGSVGGTIRFITNNPSFDGYQGEIALSAYDTEEGDSSHEVSAVANLPVIDDTLAFRVATTYKNLGGWIDQPGNENANDSELSNIRLKGLWVVNDNLVVDITAVQSRLDAGAYNQTNIGDVTESRYQVVDTGEAILPTTDNTNDHDLYNLTINYDLGFASLLSSSSYLDAERTTVSESVFLDPEATFGVIAEGLETGVKVLSQEFRLSGDGEKLDWLAGFFYADAEERSIFDEVGVYFSGLQLQSFSIDEFRSNESMAFFGSISYDLSETVSIMAGTRYFEDEREDRDLGSEKFDNLSSKLSFSYTITDTANAYFSVAEGFRSGGFTSGGETYDPETVLTYELGYKALLMDGVLAAESAVFHSTYSDYQDSLTDLDTLQTFISNAGEIEILGVEWSALLKASRYLTLSFNGNITDAEFISVDETSRFNKGDSLGDIPKYSGSVSAEFNFSWSNSTNGFARIDYNRQGGATLVTNGVEYSSSSVGFLNAQIGAQWDSFTLRLFGRNLNNENRATSVGIGSFTQHRSRTVGLDFRYEI